MPKRTVRQLWCRVLIAEAERMPEGNRQIKTEWISVASEQAFSAPGTPVARMEAAFSFIGNVSGWRNIYVFKRPTGKIVTFCRDLTKQKLSADRNNDC